KRYQDTEQGRHAPKQEAKRHPNQDGESKTADHFAEGACEVGDQLRFAAERPCGLSDLRWRREDCPPKHAGVDSKFPYYEHAHQQYGSHHPGGPRALATYGRKGHKEGRSFYIPKTFARLDARPGAVGILGRCSGASRSICNHPQPPVRAIGLATVCCASGASSAHSWPASAWNSGLASTWMPRGRGKSTWTTALSRAGRWLNTHTSSAR